MRNLLIALFHWLPFPSVFAALVRGHRARTGDCPAGTGWAERRKR
jgi:hypothetical protein